MYSSVFFSMFTGLYMHHHNLILGNSMTLRWNPVPIFSQSFSLPLTKLSSPGQPLICLLSWVCPFWMFHINEIVQYMAFSVWLLSPSIMFSKFIHVGAWISASFLSLPNCSIASIYHIFCHPLMAVWIVSTFWLLWMGLLWTFLYKHLNIFSFLLGIYVGLELLGYMVVLCLTFWRT